MRNNCSDCVFNDDCVILTNFNRHFSLTLESLEENAVKAITADLERREIKESFDSEKIKELVKGWYHAETS